MWPGEVLKGTGYRPESCWKPREPGRGAEKEGVGDGAHASTATAVQAHSHPIACKHTGAPSSRPGQGLLPHRAAEALLPWRQGQPPSAPSLAPPLRGNQPACGCGSCTLQHSHGAQGRAALCGHAAPTATAAGATGACPVARLYRSGPSTTNGPHAKACSPAALPGGHHP